MRKILLVDELGHIRLPWLWDNWDAALTPEIEQRQFQGLVPNQALNPPLANSKSAPEDQNRLVPLHSDYDSLVLGSWTVAGSG
jgi:hypothetical protein